MKTFNSNFTVYYKIVALIMWILVFETYVTFCKIIFSKLMTVANSLQQKIYEIISVLF